MTRLVPRLALSIALTLFLLLALVSPAVAAAPRDSLVVSAAWLAQHLEDPDLVLLQVGEHEAYAAAHIPGARYVAVDSDIAVSGPAGHGLTLEMPPPEVLHDRLAALGVTDKSRIVVYFDKEWFAAATRALFTLDYAGLGDRAMLLDGGIDAWIADGHAVTAKVDRAKTGSLSPLKIKPIVVDADFVRQHLRAPHFAVVDGRAAVFYDGVETGGMPGTKDKTGHIAGARSLPFSSVTDEQRHLRSAAELATLLAQAGVKPGDTVVGYCHVGLQATAMLFAARTLGYKVLLYDGSFEDWSRRDYPVDNPAAQGTTP